MMRNSAPYYPGIDAAEHWPDWRIKLADLQGAGEIIDPGSQVIMIEPIPTAQHAYAHALAHLDLGHHYKEGDLTEQDCDDADGLARLRLGEVRLNPWDGDAPTIEFEPIAS